MIVGSLEDERGRRRRLSQDGRYVTTAQVASPSESMVIDPRLGMALGVVSSGSATNASNTGDSGARVRGGHNALYIARGGLSAHRNTHRHHETSANYVAGEDEPYSPDSNSVKDDSDPLDLPRLKVSKLNAIQKIARHEIQVSSWIL